jgi:hypothetical protein
MTVYSKVSSFLINLIVLSTIAQVYATSLQQALELMKNLQTTENFFSHHVSGGNHSNPQALSNHRRLGGHEYPNTVVHLDNREDGGNLSHEFKQAINKGPGWYITTHSYNVNHFKKSHSDSSMPPVSATFNGKQKFMYLVQRPRGGGEAVVWHFQGNCHLVASSADNRNEFCTELSNDGKKYECVDDRTKDGFQANPHDKKHGINIAFGKCEKKMPEEFVDSNSGRGKTRNSRGRK